MLRRVALSTLLALGASASTMHAGIDIIEFSGFIEGAPVRDQYMFRGLRIAPDSRGGPFYDDAALFDFLLDTPPWVLNFNPLTAGSGPGRVHASVGTYIFNVVDPSNPFVASFTDHAEVVVALPDRGTTVLTAYGAADEVLATDVLELGSFEFGSFHLSVSVPGIQRFTLATPLESFSIGAVVDTVAMETPVILPHEEIEIDVRPGSRRNIIRPHGVGMVPVAILSRPGFDPGAIDPGLVLFQRARAIGGMLIDRNHDRVRDLVLEFRLADLEGLTRAATVAELTAVAPDGTSLKGTDEVEVMAPRSPGAPAEPITAAPAAGGGGRPRELR